MKMTPLDDIFDLHNGISSSGLKIFPSRSQATLPFIRPSKWQNRTISGWVDKYSIPTNKIFPPNSLFVSTNGEGSHTYSYVSSFEFVPNSDITVLIPKKEMTLKEKVFYAKCITENRYKFSYGRKPKGVKLKTLLLPSRNDALSVTHKMVHPDHISIDASIIKETPFLFSDNWEYFSINDIFDQINLGKAIHKNELDLQATGVRYPYITRTVKNNGVELRVAMQKITLNKLNLGNAITIGAEGVRAFYQKEEFFVGNKINILRSRHLNPYNAMFLTCVLNNEIIPKFHYGRAIVQNRLEKINLWLPKKGSSPDWSFMEKFIKKLPYSSQL